MPIKRHLPVGSWKISAVQFVRYDVINWINYGEMGESSMSLSMLPIWTRYA